MFMLTRAVLVLDGGNGSNCERWMDCWFLFNDDGDDGDDDDSANEEDEEEEEENGWMLWLGIIPVSL